MNRYLLISAFLSMAFAQETIWESNGIPIRQGVHIEWQKTVCPGENGTAIFVWSDTRFGARNVFAQKIDTNGSLLWGDEGAAVTHLPGRQEDPVAITDGSGGAFIAWVDYRFDEEGDIFIQHVDSDGNNLMNNEGEALAQVIGRHLTINMCTDSSGGVFVTWQDKRNLLDDDIYGTHVSADHEIVAPGTGVPIIVMNGNQGAKSLEYAGSGTALLVWMDTRSGIGNDIYAQKFNMDMIKIFADDGLPVAVGDDLETSPRTTYINHDTSFVTWQSGIESSRIYFNFLTSDGLVFSTPKAVSTFASNMKEPRVKRNMEGEIFVQWTDFRSDTTNGNHYYQKITHGGVRLWNDDGIMLDEIGNDNHARFVADSAGGIQCYWERGTYPEVDILYRKISNDGNYTSSTPIVINDADGYQNSPIVESDGAIGSFVIFADQEFGSIDLRSQLVQNDVTQFAYNGKLVMHGLDGDVNYVSAFSDGIEVVMNWVDSRNAKKLFGSRVNGDGVIDTLFNGKQMAQYEILIEELENEPVSLNVQDVGLITANFDGSTGSKLIRLNKYDEHFSPVWGDSGIYVFESSAEQRRVHLLSSSNLLVFWSEIRDEFEYDIFMQSFDANGIPQLQDGGVKIVDGNWVDMYVEAVMMTEDGNIMIFWVEDVWGSGTLRYNHITEQGNVAAHGVNGGYILDNTGDPEKLKLVALENGAAAIVAWEELHNFAKDVYFNQVNQDGTKALSTSAAMTSAANDQSNIQMAASGDKVLVVWEDFENGLDFNITGQLIDISSLELSGENFAVCDAELFQGSPSVVYDERENIFLITWEDERGVDNGDPVLSGGLDIYLTIVDESGAVFFNDGILIAGDYHNQSKPQFVRMSDETSSSSDWLIHWVDMRSSGKADLKNLYGQGIEFIIEDIDPENIPEHFAVSAAYPNPFNSNVNIDISIAKAKPFVFSVTNVLGQTVFQEIYIPNHAGTYRIHWNGRDIFNRELSSGLYIYSVKTSDDIFTGKFTYLK